MKGQWTIGFLVAAFSMSAMADDSSGKCQFNASGRSGFTTVLRIDNDLFGGDGQDQGYTNGLQLSIISPNIVNYRDDPCLPWVGRQLNGYLDWLRSGDYGDERNMIISVQHALYTPKDREAVELIEDDRPFAAALLFSMGYNARDGDWLRAGHIRVGMVGPVAMGEQVQNEWHRLADIDRFRGWDNQLHNEPVIQLIHERMRRHTLMGAARGNSGFGQDIVGHWGAALGNLSTHVNAGLEWRFGWRLPNDFGSSPLRPAGENAAPMGADFRRRHLNGHFFVNMAARWVIHDITLDGNTFRSSHSVDKEPLVGDMGFGGVVYYGDWKFAFAHFFRSREFSGQEDQPIYGSFTVSKQF